jgi:hypothetical protein
MGVLALIQRAQDAGLRLEAAGNTLKITGPKEAEPIVRLLAQHKAQVLEVLADSGLRELRKLRKITTESPQQDLHLLAQEEARCNRFEERAAVLEFDEGLPRPEAEEIARQETMAAVYDPAAGPYSFALTALRAQCPDYVPEDRWHAAITDATAFISQWGAQAQAFRWTEHELFGLHPVPERPAANYSRLARLDHMGLLWLLRGRLVVTLTATEAAYRCASGAHLTYRKQNELAPASLSEKPDDVRRAA